MSRHSKLFAWLCAHPVACFILLTVSFLVFGKLSYDLIHLFSANAEYLTDNGWVGLIEGGLEQLLELILSAFAAMAAYMIFKLCEHAMTERLRHTKSEN
ncbi:hypothetical protein [Undibacterium sp. TJN19]|uniref:hypothetical protein n=1 Tax=Undibacterium sp. TJN19 TaxID=3413055 RepID=UPI003BF18059